MNRSELLDKEYERRDQRLQNAVPMRLRKTNKQPKHLHIVYVMTWTALCGGIKIILEHCNRLTERGHKVTIVSHYPKPDWFPLDERIAFIQPGFNEVLCESIPPCDIIIAIYWTEIYECIEQGIAPVVYFEQGADHLFHPDQFKADKIAHARKQIRLAPYVYTVSNYAAQTLSEVYDVQAPVIPNAVDKTVFYPDLEMKRKNKKIVLSTIGSDYAEDKRIRHIMDCINRLRDKGYDFEFIWITPGPHDWSITEPAHTNPPQRFIGDTLRRTDIYICASRYESFCLPVLEAMTSGAAVLTTDCGGIRDYVKDGENAIVLARDDISAIPKKIEMLMHDAELRSRLSENALEAAKLFSWESTIDQIEEYYREIARYEVDANAAL